MSAVVANWTSDRNVRMPPGWGHYPHRIKQNWFQNMGWRSGEFQEIEVDALVNGEVDTGARR